MLANDQHHVGGTILIGGNVKFDDGDDTISTGPVRVLGNITTGNFKGFNVLNGVHCVRGNVGEDYKKDLNGLLYEGTGYKDCPTSVPEIRTTLKTPKVDKNEYTNMDRSINRIDIDNQKFPINVPERKSGEPEVYDFYIPNIAMMNHSTLEIRMPEGGRLTRIFTDSVFFAGHPKIRVYYGSKGIANDEYAGNLLFYVDNDIEFPAIVPEDSIQGSFISTGTIKIQQQMTLAGQLLSEFLFINANFDGKGFRYVPFDPPILEINREALAYGSFFEGSEWQEVPIKLDSIPRTDVIFNYCFEFTSNKAAADSADFFENAKGMPICGRDSGEVTILEGKTKPEGKNIVSIYPILDAKPEGLEYFNIKIFNIYGAVLPGNKKSDFFELSINDANPIPQDASVTGEEDKNLYFSSKNFPYTTTDTSGEDTLEVLKIISLPSKGSLYINGDTVKVNQEILAKDIDSLYFLGEKDEFGSPYTSFKFNVQTKWGTGEKPATMTVNLTAVNDAPTIAAGQSFNIEENKSVNSTVGTVKAIDVDGDTLTFKVLGFTALKADSTADTITVDYFNFNSSGLITTKVVLDFETMPHLYRYQVEVSDGELTDTAFVYINLLDVNEAPIVKNAEFDIEENDNPNKVLGSIEASDVDAADTVLSYSISGEDSQYFKIDAKTGQLSVNNTVFDYEDSIPNVFTFSVIVTDNVLGSAKSTLSDTATVTVTVLDVNDAPTVEGAEFDIEENNNPNLILDTIKASDVDSGTVLTYSISGEGSEHFVIDATTGQLSVNNTVFDYEDSKPNVFTFTVTVTDNGLQGKGQTLSATASIKITIIDTPEAPKFTQDKYEFDVEEEHGNNVLVGQVEATDEDTEDSELTYKILSSIVTNEGKLVDYFVIDSKTGEIRVKPGLILDYETHDHFYTLKVSVSDGALFDTTTVLIELIDINEAPIVKGAEFEIDENNNPNLNLGKIEASDVDAGTVLTYSISGEGSEYFVINATTGQLSVNNTVFDYEDSKPNVFTFTVTVTDNGLQGKGPSLSDTASIKITIIDIPEAPKFTQDKYEFDVEEEHEKNVLVGQVEATDEDTEKSKLTYSIISSKAVEKSVNHFVIDPKTGEIRVKPGLILDYETHDHFYTLKVSVSDGALFDTTTVLIELIDINEAPIVKNVEFTINENNEANDTLGTIKASDVDAGTVLTYSISGEGSEYFVIDATTGQLSVNNTVFDYEDSKPNVFTFTVTVTDNGLQGKGPSLSDTASIKITIIDIPEAPKFTQDKYEFDVEEEHEKNVLVGQVEATDEDTEKSKLTYSIISSKAVEKSVNHFVIDPKTGEIRVKPGLILDYETHDHFYTLKVSVSDGALFDTTTVLIELIDINEAPIVKNVEFTINENNEANDTLGTIKASDVDAGTVLTYSISGEGSEYFVIDATTGQLSVNNTVFDYEDSKPNVFTFTVTVTDNGLQGEGDFLSTSAIVKVTVKDVNEAPELADVTFDVDENSPAGTVVGLLEAFDPDANDVLKYSILEGNTGSIFVLNATTGLITVRNSNSLNYEEMENHKFELIVRVVDKGGLADTAKVTIVVNDINDAPVIAAGQKFEIFENNKNEAIVGEIHVSDEDGDVLTFDFVSLNAGTKAVDYFDLYTDGTIRVKSGLQLDYETMPHVYELKFSVSDGDTTITGSVAIHLLDLNEAPVVDDQNFGIEENSPAGALVGVIQASDPDKVASFNTLSYKVLSGNEAELFVIDSKTGKITVRKSNSLDYETMPHLYLLTVEVSDGELQDTATISIDLLDVNDPPTVEDLETNIDENVPYGTVIDTVIAHDEDSPDLEYSFVKDPASESFSIDNNGVITVNGPLDYETRNEYIVKVVVFDGDSRDTALVIIRINNVNEAPVIENQAFSAKEDISSKHRIGVVQYKDPENDPLVFTIIQDTSSLFRITPSGEIYLKDGASLDYEKTTEYVIQVKGVDPGGLMDSAYVTINVLDVFEKTEVEIVVVVTTDSIHSYPDTVYTNSSYVELEWDVDGNRFYGDTLLEKGKNVIIKKYCDLSKNECGLDTVVIFYSNESPKVDLSLKVGEKEKVSGVTIVEEKDKKDSLNYINKEKNQLVVTVKDPSPDGGTTVNRFEIEAQLKTINVPSSVFDDLSVISKNWQFEPKKEKVEITVDGRTKLKYETKVKGYSVTVVYDPAKDSSTAKVIYTAIVNGEKVEVSFKADRDTGKLIKDDGGSYAVTYSYKDKRNNTMLISYPVNSSGKVVKTKEEGGVIYTVGYSYTNAYGNTAIQSTKILLDTIPPVVQIIDPVEGVTISSVSVDVKWTVDGIVQDTLNLQGLEKGVNRIIRAYRDKAGNETADTVYVIMKGAKDIVVKIENPMIEITKKKLDQFKDGLDDDALYRVSILNPSTNLEQELIVGTKGGNKKGSNDEPYPYLSGSHLGPTLEIDVKMPSLNPTGGLASLADLVESDRKSVV